MAQTIETASRSPLIGMRCGPEGADVASCYARSLLDGLGADVDDAMSAPRSARDPAIEWATSGAMDLTGEADGPPRLVASPLASCARGALGALTSVAAAAGLQHETLGVTDGSLLLGERAATLALRRRGRISPGGSCRLLRASDGWIAVNLAREEVWSSVNAWLEADLGATAGRGSEAGWNAVAEGVGQLPAEALVDRARTLGMPVAWSEPPASVPPPWLHVYADADDHGTSTRHHRPPLVVDLSSLWAGPLCTRLLGLAGARVLKVESLTRPDGARRGPAGFFDRMHSGKQSVAFDFRSDAGRAALRSLVERADIVVESARPRALAQLGIDAEACVRASGGPVWVSLTGYGRAEPYGGWVAFGDDAAVAAGAAHVAAGKDVTSPVFCGDAIADPLAGSHAALAALAYYVAGRPALLDVSLRSVVAHVLGCDADRVPPRAPARVLETSNGRFEVHAGNQRALVAAPRALPLRGSARPLGADTTAVAAEFGLPC